MRFLALLLLLWPGAVMAQWSGFYTPTERAAEPEQQRSVSGPVAVNGMCIREILLAQLRHQIPGNLLLGIGLQESGLYRGGELTVWPYTANAAGTGKYFNSEDEAVHWVRELRAQGTTSIDVGCMQINMHWHPDAFDTIADGFNPRRNVEYAAEYLVRLYEKKGDWAEAAASYHSGTEDLQKAYLGRLEQNLKVANARLDDFQEMAGASAPQTAQAPTAPARRMPTTGVFWTAWLGREAHDGQGGRTLFGPNNNAPILPALSQGS